MDDYGWCPLPQCNSPSELDRSKNFGECTQCRFKFCLLCKDKYHFGKRCPALKVDLRKDEKLKADPNQV